MQAKLSDLIAKLEEAKEQFGDLPLMMDWGADTEQLNQEDVRFLHFKHEGTEALIMLLYPD